MTNPVDHPNEGKINKKQVLSPAVIMIGLGILTGLGVVTFFYAEGLSYLSSDPKACVNCHIMRSEYDGWQKASHHTVATCVDCHLPTDFIGKYAAKARNGWNHSKAFTLQNFPEPILITPINAEILQANCLRCHEDMVQNLAMARGDEAPQCVQCHGTVGHGDMVGLGGPWNNETELEGLK